MPYDYLIFDTVNTGYQVFNHPDQIKENKSEFIQIQDKRIYKNFLKNFIERVDFLKTKFLKETGELIFLFDNYESREELKELLKPLNSSQNRRKVNSAYKSTRVNQKFEFYNTLDVVRYYYIVQSSEYHTARIPNLEADDLVPACLRRINPNNDKDILLITNDSDWCRYLSDKIHYLPNLHDSPVDNKDFERTKGFPCTEGKIILNKIICGDTADNIEAVFPEWDSTLKSYVLDIFEDIQDLMINAHKYPEVKSQVQIIKERENDIRLAYQMLQAIPIAVKHFDAIYTTGRNSDMVLRNIRKKLYDTPEENAFVFGMNIPRLNP